MENDEESGAPEHNTRSQPTRRHREPDERTRLLQPSEEGYLSPDDPAVSPYNLWSVRATRYLSVFFLIITFLWWILLLVSIFISPYPFNSRGSGFFDFSYTTLTGGYLLVGLLFFSVPSRAMMILSLIISVILLVDMIIILSVARLRLEEGWIGIASVIWATLMSLWNILSNRTVRWGKREEEERLTGRAETRKTLREWCAVFTATFIMAIMVIITILLTATLSLRARDATLLPPGERIFVDGDQYQVHFACVGNVTYNDDGSRRPTIILEAGEDPVEESLEPFVYDAWMNGTIDRYCYWDRPGYAWSDNAPSSHSAGMSADALSEALAVAGERGPWILVSAGLGSIHSRIFSSRHGRDIKGLLMIDPLHEDLLYKVGSPGRGFALWGQGILSPLGLDRLPGALFKGRSREDRVYGKSAYQGGKFIKAKLQENLVALSLTKNEILGARTIQRRKVPLVVVSSGVEVRKSQEWESKQEELTKLTRPLLAWDAVDKAKHQVWKTLEGRQTIEKRLGELYDYVTKG